MQAVTQWADKKGALIARGKLQIVGNNRECTILTYVIAKLGD
jgi:hypothetical protein